ncbi:MAG: hypothetical protein ACXVEF_37350 [Polyangiales bacterium]
MRRALWIVAGLLLACSSSNSESTSAADSSVSDTSSSSDAPIETTTESSSSCALGGACFDDFLGKQTTAATCFGHFGIKCGKFNADKTQCRWDDGAGFDLVAEDAGGTAVVYKSATGTECFRRASNGDLTFPGGTTYTSKIVTMPVSDDNTLTIGCKPSGEFTGTLVQYSECGIDLRTCCN